MQPFGQADIDFEVDSPRKGGACQSASRSHTVRRMKRSDYDRPGALLLLMVGILAAWLQELPRIAWALFGTVVLLMAYAVHATMRKRPSFLLTETGDFLLTETGDRILLEAS
jgi:hypothetical protein